MGCGGIWLLSGEPGMGKSRLAEEVVRRAIDIGFSAAWGRCWEAGGAPAFWPWVQALRVLCRGRSDDVLPAPVHDQLCLLLPELAGSSEYRGMPNLGSTSDRFQLLDAITSAICEMAVTQPLLIVLDDLHVADHSSLALLDFATRQFYAPLCLCSGRTVEARLRDASILG